MLYKFPAARFPILADKSRLLSVTLLGLALLSLTSIAVLVSDVLGQLPGGGG